MDKAIYLLLGAALTWMFYFIQRRAERRGTTEAIDRHQRLLALKQGLEGANLNLDDLRRFEHRLLGKAESAARIADSYFSKAEEVARHGSDDTDPADIVRHARQAYTEADTRLVALIAHLRAQLDAEGLAIFDEAQRAWLAFRERYARFIAQSYAGGPIRPLIHAVTLESITTAWAAELETQLGSEEEAE